MPIAIHKNTMKSWQLKWAKKFALRNFWSSKYGLYHNTRHLFTEYEAFKVAKKIKPGYLHVAFMEDTLGYLADKKKELPCKLFATSHQPPAWWKMTQKNIETVKALDGLIVLSNEAKAFFDKIIPGRVAYIPHGVDTTFFDYQPREQSSPVKRILFVGNWLRDFETFVRTVEMLETNEQGKYAYDMVYPGMPESPGNPLHRLMKYNNITWYKNIPDNQLKQLYYNAALLCIPFTDATGNNALLEAAACGTPILTTRLSSIVDCFGSDDNFYAVDVNEAATFVKCIQHITNPINEQEIAGKAMRLSAYVLEHLDWKMIAKQHCTFFESN